MVLVVLVVQVVVVLVLVVLVVVLVSWWWWCWWWWASVLFSRLFLVVFAYLVRRPSFHLGCHCWLLLAFFLGSVVFFLGSVVWLVFGGWSSVVASDVLKDKIMCIDSSFIAGDI